MEKYGPSWIHELWCEDVFFIYQKKKIDELITYEEKMNNYNY